MGIRVVNGNTFTEDGWPLVDQDGCNWVTIPGTNPPVTIQIQKGQPTWILRAWEADWNAYVEPLRDADTACWTEGNSVLGQPGRNNGSNHLGGTATDSNWSSHRFQISYDGFNEAQIATMREMLDFYEGNVFWAQDWDSPKDCMHSQMGYGTYDQENNRPFPKVDDFIARKIRADGFSTFRRGNTPAPPPPLSRADGYAVKIIQEGQRRDISPRGIQIALATGLVESNLTVYANAKVPASMAIPHDAVGSDGYSVGIFQQQVRDTGNGWWWGDAATCMDPTSSAGLFYDRLAQLDYNGPNSPGSYAQAVQQSAFPDRYDQRFAEAVNLYNRLATMTAPQGEGFLMALSDQQQQELYDAVCGQRPSQSPVHPPGEGNIGNMRDVVGYIDGSIHWLAVKQAAELGHPKYLALLRSVAADATRPDDANLAQAILADIQAKQAAPQVVNGSVTSLPAPTQPQVVYLPAPAPAIDLAPATVVDSSDTGKVIGDLYTALERLKLADALPIEARAPLSALISVLSTKNGSQL